MNSEQLLREATDWFVRLQDMDRAGPGREAFDAWLLRTPAHIEAYLKVSRTWGELGWAVDETPSVDELVAAARAESDEAQIIPLAVAPAAVAKRQWRRPFALAATVVLTLGVLAWFAADRWWSPQRLQTAIGEQRSIMLSDGSIAHLNTDSQIQLRFDSTQRRIELLRGEARFSVARDAARPFIVTTDQAAVRALGTVFNVQTSAGQTSVAVIEGRVAVTRPAQETLPALAPTVARLELKAGQHASVTEGGGILPDTGPSVEQALAWSERQLVFRDEPLSRVIVQFNRYHEHPIRIEDAELATLRINGVFDTRDSASLIEYLERYRNVQTRELPQGGQIISLRR